MKKRVVIGELEAYDNALALLRRCSTDHGFLASPSRFANYRRIWGRDSMICSLAALVSGEEDLVLQVKKSLLTLMRFQHKHGQIPSNVDARRGKVSYGMSTGRLDATLWFIIVFSQYVKRTKDYSFLREYYAHVKCASSISHLYEFNDRGLIYVPKGGDWADEYIQEGYVLYDELLYYQALKEYTFLREKLGKGVSGHKKTLSKLKRMILVNYAPSNDHLNSRFVYQKNVFSSALRRGFHRKPYLLPYFNTSGYGFRFDGMANSLALLFGILPSKKRDEVVSFIKREFSSRTNFLLPSFYPVITKSDHDWQELKQSFQIRFRNKPYEYHNSGLWPVITGFFASAVAPYDKVLAEKYLEGLNFANHHNRRGKPTFFEFHHGKSFKPKGNKFQAWSAAASILAYNVVVKDGRSLL